MSFSYSIHLSCTGCTSSTKGSLTFKGRSKGLLAIFDQLLKATCEGMKAQPGTDTAPTVKHGQGAQPSTPRLS